MAKRVEYSKKERRKRIESLYKAMTPVQGETRTIEECNDCGQLFGRRFVPYGLGHGLTVGVCLCQITAHRTSKTISTRES